MSDNDAEVKQMLLSIIKEEFPLEKEQYYTQLKLRNYKKTREIVHKIKHKINAVGLVESYALANDYENDLRNEKLELSKEFDEILTAISNFIKTF